ncbi:MAG: hypothetical protein WA322_19595, partial [Pseudolabrys sp.]
MAIRSGSQASGFQTIRKNASILPSGECRLLNRSFVRALLASVAVIATAIALAGCDPDSITPTGRSQALLSEKMLADIAAKNMDKDSPILARIFKEEA